MMEQLKRDLSLANLNINMLLHLLDRMTKEVHRQHAQNDDWQNCNQPLCMMVKLGLRGMKMID